MRNKNSRHTIRFLWQMWFSIARNLTWTRSESWWTTVGNPIYNQKEKLPCMWSLSFWSIQDLLSFVWCVYSWSLRCYSLLVQDRPGLSITLISGEKMIRCPKCHKMNLVLNSRCWYCDEEFFAQVRSHDDTTEIPKQCPKCSSDMVIPIEYGMPSPEMQEEYNAGKIQLGGCMVDPKNPEWHCKRCKHRWK